MADMTVAEMVEELALAFDKVGEVEDWIARRLDGTVDRTTIESAFCEVTQHLADDGPPTTDQWEHLLVAAATFSALLGHHYRLTFMTGDYIHFVTFNITGQDYGLFFTWTPLRS